MKSRNLYLAALACAAVAVPGMANAQTEEVISETAVQVNCDPTTHYISNWRDNWFIQVGAGINQPLVERGVGAESNLKRVDKTKMTVAYNFGFGRWFSPYFGFRFNAIGGALHWDNPTADQPLRGWTHA